MTTEDLTAHKTAAARHNAEILARPLRDGFCYAVTTPDGWSPLVSGDGVLVDANVAAAVIAALTAGSAHSCHCPRLMHCPIDRAEARLAA